VYHPRNLDMIFHPWIWFFNLGYGFSKLGSQIHIWIKSIRKFGKYSKQKI